MIGIRRLALLAVFLSLAGLPACGGKDKGPSGPTAGVPTPSPTAQPTATPPPANVPSLPQSCRSIPPSNGSPSGCAKRSPNFFNQVKDAVSLAAGSTYRDPYTNQTYDVVQGNNKIVVAGAYLKIIIDALDRQGICAVYDGEEIYATDGGGYNEQYDVITSAGFSWVSYSVTCRPALPMPALPPPAPVRDPECRNLPPSASIFCAGDSSVYDGDVWDAQDLLIAEDRARSTPQIFNFGQRLSNTTYGFMVINEPLYTSELLKKIRAKGYCSMFDGDEFLVKRNNVFSEHMKMMRSDGFAIRAHISTCRDSAF